MFSTHRVIDYELEVHNSTSNEIVAKETITHHTNVTRYIYEYRSRDGEAVEKCHELIFKVTAQNIKGKGVPVTLPPVGFPVCKLIAHMTVLIKCIY